VAIERLHLGQCPSRLPKTIPVITIRLAERLKEQPAPSLGDERMKNDAQETYTTQKVTCPSCKSVVRENRTVCPACGATLSGIDRHATPHAAAAGPRQPTSLEQARLDRSERRLRIASYVGAGFVVFVIVVAVLKPPPPSQSPSTATASPSESSSKSPATPSPAPAAARPSERVESAESLLTIPAGTFTPVQIATARRDIEFTKSITKWEETDTGVFITFKHDSYNPDRIQLHRRCEMIVIGDQASTGKIRYLTFYDPTNKKVAAFSPAFGLKLVE
jgi:hypothetical protein